MKIDIFEYNPQWPANFLAEKENIRFISKELEPEIEHIGSTSVPGLGAKPIIDILVGVKNEITLDLVPDLMIPKGFTYYRVYNYIMPERRLLVKLVHPDHHAPPQYFDKDEPNPVVNGFISLVNCHCVVLGSVFWERHIAFRNYLRNNAEAREQYYQLKKDLSLRDWADRHDYAYAKTDFIGGIEVMALNENKSN